MRAHIVLTFCVGMPHAVARHTVGLPDTFFQICRQRHAGGAFQHIPQQPCAAGGVRPVLAGRMRAAQAGHQLTYAVIGAGSGFTLGKPGEVRLRISVVLIPRHPGGVANQLLQGHTVPGGAFQVGFILGDEIVERVNFALFNRHAHQGGNHGFAHRARCPESGVGIAFCQIFPGHFAIFQHQHAADVLAPQVILQIPGLTVHPIACVG